ncbi:hypothetical protein [Mucilaginibacter sp. 10B2]|uniref:hypothetical protein n=1 Tax=Mucilaginibacter sp. 10B2 TaxID=3048574 RepID=UPI002B23E684|nr:hypothetical protein [Mucilaginibacter sp. 10B2]MEB0278971.1 hypothetical protein [Mucilaginibacter sp. 10B2]
MSEKINPKDLSFSKTDRRMLIKSLEKLYCTELFRWDYHKRVSYADAKKTNIAIIDRRYRLRIKAIEMVLHQIGSEFMENVTPSIRKTASVNCGDVGTLQSRKTIMDNFHNTRKRK